MAVELATAYVSLVPSARGIGAQVARELAPTTAVAGAVGAQASTNMARGFASRIGGIGAQMTQVGKLMTLGITAPLVAVGTVAVKSAINFESAWADVVKTVDGTRAQMAGLRQGIIDMANRVPASREAIAGVAAAAGQLGIQVPNILGFTRTMVDLGESTNLSAEEAATSLARLANITEMPQSQFKRLGSTVVALGNNLATTEAEIVEMGLRIAGAGKQIGLTQAEILGFAGALSSVGIEAQAGGSAISRVMIDMANVVASGGEDLGKFAKVAGMSSSEFRRAFERDAAGAIITFIEGLRRVSDEGGNVFGVLDDLGLSEIRVRDALLRASGAGDLFRKSVRLGSQAWKENTALTEEANKRYRTTESRLKIARNRATDVARRLGERLAPALIDIVDASRPLVNFLGRMADAFARLPQPVQTGIIALAALAAIIGPILVVIGSIAQAAPIIALAIKGIGIAIGVIVGAISAPIAIAVAAIAALVAIGYVIVRNWDTIKEAATAAWGAIGNAVSSALGAIGDFFGQILSFGPKILGFFTSLPGLIGRGLAALPGLLVRGVSAAFDALLTLLIEWPLKALSYMIIAGIVLVRGIINGLTTAIPTVIDFFVKLPGRIIGVLGAVGRWLVRAGMAIIGGLRRGITTAVVAVWNFFRQLPGRVIRFFQAAPRWLINAGRVALRGLLSGAQGGASDVLGWFRRLPGAIMRAVGNVGRVLWNAGGAVIRGLGNGIRAAWRAVVGWFANIGRRVWDKIKSGLGPLAKFLSPKSQYGVQIGEGLGLGIVAGIERILPKVGSTAGALGKQLAISPPRTPGAVAAGLTAAASAPPSARTPIVLQIGGSGTDRRFLEWLRHAVRAEGGDVQTVLGQR